MNSWCESCARKNCCYTMEIRPKCYLPTTNTAHGTPETYLEKSLRDSRDSHEIATTEQSSKVGEWIGTEYDGYADGNPVYYEWICSECKCVVEDEEPMWNYCPNCGAKMKG